MDKKQKKRLDVLQQRLQKLRILLAAARKQCDDPADIPRLEKEILAVESELQTLKQG